ncbi:MAG: EamA family transporter [Ktedonobacterales bacterium]
MRRATTSAAALRGPAGYGRWLIMLAAVLWGTVGVTTQMLYRISATNPLSVGFFRLGLATPCLAVACWSLLGRRMFHIARRDLAVMALIGMMLALYQVCFFAAIARVGVTVATLVTLCTAPVLVALLSVACARERLARPVVLALVCAVSGIGLVVGGRPGAARTAADTVGVLLALGSALGYAVVTLAARAIAGRYHALQINTVGFGCGALVLLPIALASGFAVIYPARGWLLLVYLGTVPTALAYVLFLTGMRSTIATVASILTLLEPLTATLLAWVLFGERLGPLGLVGACLLLGAMAVLARPEKPAR